MFSKTYDLSYSLGDDAIDPCKRLDNRTSTKTQLGLSEQIVVKVLKT